MSLFDEKDLVEVQSGAYPGERLAVCRNPLMAAERARKRNGEGWPAHSFRTLLGDLATLTKNRVAPRLSGAAPFDILARPTELQREAFRLLGVWLQ